MADVAVLPATTGRLGGSRLSSRSRGFRRANQKLEAVQTLPGKDDDDDQVAAADEEERQEADEDCG